jgi:hypothetical protein
MNYKNTLILVIVAGLLTTAFILDVEVSNFSTAGDAYGGQATQSVEGELSGFDCAVVGVLCPTTHRGADYTTGVFTEDEQFYFIVNIPQSFLQQYFRQSVEVEGEVYDGYEHAVEPETIHLIEDDERRLIYESGYFIDEDGNRATFQDGVYQNGQWKVSE